MFSNFPYLFFIYYHQKIVFILIFSILNHKKNFCFKFFSILEHKKMCVPNFFSNLEHKKMCVPEHMEHMGCVPLEHTLSCVPNLEHKASCVSKIVDFSNTPRTLPILDLGRNGVCLVLPLFLETLNFHFLEHFRVS